MARKISIYWIALMSCLSCVQFCLGTCIPPDSISLFLYQPTENGYMILDKVVNSPHQWHRGEGSYTISQTISSDSVMGIKIIYDSTFRGTGLNNFLGNKYIGCIAYRDKIFFLSDSFETENVWLFQKTSISQNFINYGTTLINIINDRIVTWSFLFVDGALISERISPPSVIIEFDDGNSELTSIHL